MRSAKIWPPVRNSPLTRALVRIRGARSTDDRDVARELRRALNRAAQRKGNPQRVQVAAETLTADDYARWSERKLRRGALTSAPTVAPGHYALVLVAFDPASTEQFIRHGAATHLTPPKVGEFTPAVEPTVALAGVLAYWLDAFEPPSRWLLPFCTQVPVGESPISALTGRWRPTCLSPTDHRGGAATRPPHRPQHEPYEAPIRGAVQRAPRRLARSAHSRDDDSRDLHQRVTP